MPSVLISFLIWPSTFVIVSYCPQLHDIVFFCMYVCMSVHLCTVHSSEALGVLDQIMNRLCCCSSTGSLGYLVLGMLRNRNFIKFATCFHIVFWLFITCWHMFLALSLSLSPSITLSLPPSSLSPLPLSLTALRCLYDYTIASCVYSACQYIFRRNNNRLKHIESTTSVEDMEVSEMKEKLKFHFMNPFQKWRYEPRRRFPWKLIVQLTSMFLVTLQVSA